MKKTDEIETELLNALENGEPIEAIREKYATAKGSYYIALGRATEVVISKLEGVGTELRNFNAKAAQGRETLKDLERDIEDKERRSTEIAKANHDASRALDEKMTELSAKEKLLKRFRAMKTSPTEALKLIGGIKNLRRELAALDEAATEKVRELANFERHTPELKENYEAWKSRRNAEMRKVWDLTSQGSRLSNQAGQLFQYVEGLKREATDLEGKCSAMHQTKDELASEIQALRQKRPKLIFINKGLSADIVAQRVELARLVQASETLAANITSAGGKILEVLSAEREREARTDKEFAARTTVLRMAYDELITRGDIETEKEIHRRVGDRLEKLPTQLERAETSRIEVMTIGTQKGIMMTEIKELKAERAELEKDILALQSKKANLIPELVAVGG